MNRPLATTIAILTLTTALAACNETPVGEPMVSSETHWLQACDSDAVCGETACVCNVCTLLCVQDEDCAPLGGTARCAEGGTNAHGAVCGLEQVASEGICLPLCASEADSDVCGTLSAQNSTPPLVCVAEQCVPENRKVDILWVIDDSGSMCEEQAQIRENIRLFVESLTFANINFNMAVITTDGRKAGQFQNTPDGDPGTTCTVTVDVSHCEADLPHVISSRAERYINLGIINIDALQRDFGCVATVGTSGSGFEMGLEAARQALSDDLLAGLNDGFLRPEAHLAVFFLTDENDCSHTDGDLDLSNGNVCEWEADKLTPVQDYIDFLAGLKRDDDGNPDPDRVIVGGIISPDNGIRTPTGEEVLPACSSALGEAYSGYRYEQLIAAFSQNRQENICADNILDDRSQLAETIIGAFE